MALARATTARLALACLLLFAAARGALHVATFHLPLSTDDAVPMIQVRMLWHGQPVTTLINQPYNGTLDTYLIAPLTLLFASHAAFRVYQLLAAMALIGVVAVLARRAGGAAAAWAAALAAALGTPYMAMNTAIGPVPNFLVGIVVAVVVILLWPADAGSAGIGRGFAAGVAAGLGTWNTVLTVPCLAGSLGGLFAAGVPLGRAAIGFVPGFAVGLAPSLVARLIGASGVTAATRVQPYAVRTSAHWGEGLDVILRVWQGLFGIRIPLVVDGPEWTTLPAPIPVLVAVALVVLLALGIRRCTLPFLGWALVFSAAFALSARPEWTDVRYAYNLTIPVLVLAGCGLVRAWQRHRAAACVLAAVIAIPWLWGQQIVLARWRDPQHAARVWQVPDLQPTIVALDRLHVASAYASFAFACRLVVETDGRVLASQAWNERMPGDPLRYRDEVDLDPHATWLLSSWLSRGMPRAAGFREILRAMGGLWREETVGEMTSFYEFQPPFDEGRAVPAREITVTDESDTPLPAAVLDRDPTTGWRAPAGISRGAGIRVRVSPSRRLSAIVLVVDPVQSPLGVPWVATVGDQIVARGPERFAMQWVGGVPRAGKQAVMTVVLPEAAAVSEVRIIFQDAGPPLWISEVFAYGPDETPQPAAGAAAADGAYAQVREGQWPEAVRLYEDAVRASPDRASYHASLVRARWRAAHRQHLDVESLDDGGDAVLHLRR